MIIKELLHNEILVKKHTDQEYKEGLIKIPTAKGFNKSYGHSEICEVIKIGNRSEHKGNLKEGDFIVCQHNEGKQIKNTDYWRMHDKWVMAIVPKEDALSGRVTAQFPRS